MPTRTDHMEEDLQELMGILCHYDSPQALPQVVIDEAKLKLKAIYARGHRNGRASKYCGCAWCCKSVPFDERSEMHKRTCGTS